MNRSIHSYEFGKVATAGYYIALRVGFVFPMAEQNFFPPDWVDRYTQQGLMLHDPVLKWVYDNTGSVRWSELEYDDPRRVLQSASEYGMHYGVAVCCDDEEEEGGLRSFGTFARPDREFTTEEIDHLWSAVYALHVEARPPENLTPAELEVLQMMRDGLLMKQIAAELGVSLNAIKQRLRNAKNKLRAKTNSQATALAIEYGLL